MFALIDGRSAGLDVLLDSRPMKVDMPVLLGMAAANTCSVARGPPKHTSLQLPGLALWGLIILDCVAYM